MRYCNVTETIDYFSIMDLTIIFLYNLWAMTNNFEGHMFSDCTKVPSHLLEPENNSSPQGVCEIPVICISWTASDDKRLYFCNSSNASCTKGYIWMNVTIYIYRSASDKKMYIYSKSNNWTYKPGESTYRWDIFLVLAWSWWIPMVILMAGMILT